MDPQVEKQNEAVFQTMVGELLAETKVFPAVYDEVQAWVLDLKQKLMKEDSAKQKSKLMQSMNPDTLPLPAAVRRNDEALKNFSWAVPTKVKLIGSYYLRTAVNNLSSVDVLVEMPKSCLVKSDLLNHKYHIKRAAYLVLLASKLKTLKLGDMEFTCLDGLRVLPVLKVRVREGLNALIHVVPPEDLFDFERRLSPGKNNLRFSHFYPESECSEEEACSKGTPIYNHTISMDIKKESLQEGYSETLSNVKLVHDIAVLLKVWLKQRDLHEGYGALNGFLVTTILKNLCDTGTLFNGLSMFQMLRTVFNYISHFDWDSKEGRASLEGHVKEWSDCSEVVLCDDTEILNFCATMSKHTMERIRNEAKQALKSLTCINFQHFQTMFMKPVNFVYSYDHVLRLDIDKLPRKLRERKDVQWKVLDCSGDIKPAATGVIVDVIQKCLRNRIEAVGVKMEPTESWTSTPEEKSEIIFGWTINPTEAHKQVEKCESSDDQVVAAFKAFWGGKSELRRFRDGSISDSIVFRGDKRRICFQMVTQALELHVGISLTKRPRNYLDVQLEECLEPQYEVVSYEQEATTANKKGPKKRKIKSVVDTQQITPVELEAEVSVTLEKLSKLLRSLDLPLAITTVQGVSPVIRGADPFPSPAQNHHFNKMLMKTDTTTPKRWRLNDEKNDKKSMGMALPFVPELVSPISVQVQLEHNNKWPDDIEAVNRLKCALLIKMGQMLSEKYKLVCHASSFHLDVLLNGFVFQVWLLCGKEILLYKTVKEADGLEKVKDTDDSIALEREGVHLPKLTTTLHTFSLHHNCYSRVVHLAKRWIAAHMMLNYPVGFQARVDPNYGLSEEAVELLVAHLFVNHEPYLSPPHEVQVGFLRFLELMAWTDWRSVAVIVNFNEGLSSDEVQDIEREFHKRRAGYPALVIATPYDKTGSVWTRGTLGIVLKKVAALAEKSITYLRSVLVKSGVDKPEDLKESVEKIYSSSREVYDAIIWLMPKYTSRGYQKTVGMKKPVLKVTKYNGKRQGGGGDETTAAALPIIDFDPVRIYMQSLYKAFDHVALFFHNTYGGDLIGIVWKQGVLEPKEMNVSNSRGRVMNDDKLLELDMDKTAAAMKILGAGLVDRIQVLKHY